MSELLIIGAGPVGLTLALACQRFGLKFRIIDKLPAPAGLSKALAIWSATLEALDVLKIADRFLERGIHARGMRISHGRQLLIEVSAGLGLDTPYPQMLLLPQSETEEILTQKLGELGVDIERGVELISLEQSFTGVRVELRRPDGQVEETSVRWVAACDGAHSTVRHLIGADFEGNALHDVFVLCDAEVEGGISPDFAQLFWSANGLLAIFPVRKNSWRVIASRSNNLDESEATLEELQRLLDQRGPGGWILRKPTWLSKFRISERKVSHYHYGRVMLAGDAAHIHSPAGGQGMNTGMQDAFNLAWKLAIVAAGHGDENTLLESYDAERSPVAEKVLRASGKMIRLNFSKHPFAQFIRDTIVHLAGHSEKVKKEIALSLSGLDIHYRPGAYVASDVHWQEASPMRGFIPGSRPRDVQVFSGEEPVQLFREIQSPFFTLLLFSGVASRPEDIELLVSVCQIAERAGDLIRIVKVWHGKDVPSEDWLLDPEGAAHRKFGVSLPSFYLIRPDQYVSLRCQPAEAGVLKTWMDEKLSPAAVLSC